MSFTQQRVARFVVVVGFAVFFSAVTAQATIITLTAGGDPAGTSSFNTAGKWSDSLAPHSDADYLIGANLYIRTPADGAAYTFGGNSLTVSNGYNPSGISYKGTGSTLTVNDLRLDNGNIGNGLGGVTWTLAGNITLQNGGGYLNAGQLTGATNVSANISGLGTLTVWNNIAGTPTTGKISLTGTNSYQGGTTVAAKGILDVKKDGGLGTGDVTVASKGKLVLESGLTNNYINDTAKLLLANSTDSLVSLAFTGTDTIAKLSFDGGATYAASGTWGAVGNLGATHTSSVFSGTGILNIVPEPSTVILLVTGMLGLLAYAWRRQK